jgi:hypothetical protein
MTVNNGRWLDWFGKSSSRTIKDGYKAILQVKTGHGLYPKKYIDVALKEAPGGVWIVLELVHQDVQYLLLLLDIVIVLISLYFCCYKGCQINKQWKSGWHEVY